MDKTRGGCGQVSEETGKPLVAAYEPLCRLWENTHNEFIQSASASCVYIIVEQELLLIQLLTCKRDAALAVLMGPGVGQDPLVARRQALVLRRQIRGCTQINDGKISLHATTNGGSKIPGHSLFRSCRPGLEAAE